MCFIVSCVSTPMSSSNAAKPELTPLHFKILSSRCTDWLENIPRLAHNLRARWTGTPSARNMLIARIMRNTNQYPAHDTLLDARFLRGTPKHIVTWMNGRTRLDTQCYFRNAIEIKPYHYLIKRSLCVLISWLYVHRCANELHNFFVYN